MDTHVHQIAIKHYGLRGSSGTKANMTPKLYDEVNTKLAKVWGDYAGWAHSVINPPPILSTLIASNALCVRYCLRQI